MPRTRPSSNDCCRRLGCIATISRRLRPADFVRVGLQLLLLLVLFVGLVERATNILALITRLSLKLSARLQ